jgi:hypothetical protein
MAERFLIVVPSLAHKGFHTRGATIRVRLRSITIATFAAMMLLYTLFAKFVPIISIWEMKAADHQPPAEGHAHAHAPAATDRLEGIHA